MSAFELTSSWLVLAFQPDIINDILSFYTEGFAEETVMYE